MSNLAPDQIQWRVGNTFDRNGKKMGRLLGYINARTTMDELDKIDAGWTFDFAPVVVDGGQVLAAKGCVTAKGIMRCDVGISVPSDQDPTKTAVSDSLKRAAVHHGVGRELYELPEIFVECEIRNNGKVGAPKALPEFKNGKWTIDRTYGYVRYSEVADKPEPAAPVGAGDGGDNEDRHSTVAQRDELKALADKYGLTKDELGILRKSHTDKAKSSEFTNRDINAMKVAIEEAGRIKVASGGVIEG